MKNSSLGRFPRLATRWIPPPMFPTSACRSSSIAVETFLLHKKTTYPRFRRWLKWQCMTSSTMALWKMLVFDSWVTATVIISMCHQAKAPPHLNCQPLLLKIFKSPFSCDGTLTNVFVSNGDFSSWEWGRGAIRDVTVSRSMPALSSPTEVLGRPAAFWTHYLKALFDPACTLSLLCPLLTRRNWICEVIYLFICGCCVLWSFCGLPPSSPGQMALNQVSHQQSPFVWLTSLPQWGH